MTEFSFLRRGCMRLALVALAVLPFWPSLAGDFIEDDRPIIRDRAELRDPSAIPSLFAQTYWPRELPGGLNRPLTMTSYALDRVVWGVDATGAPSRVGIHASNLILNALAALMLFEILRERCRSRFAAFVAAALFAVHPVHVVSLMRKNLLVSSLLLCAATSMYGQPAFACENWVGSWKLNAEKSTFGSSPAVRAQTLKFEATPAGIKLTSEGTDALGKPMQGEYTSKFDGKDVAWTGNPSADTACPTRIDDNRYDNVWKSGGKPTITAKVVVSANNKILTITQTPTDAAAKGSVAVYDRQ